MELKVKKMRDNAILPTRGDVEAAGIDLYACIDEPIYLHANKSIMIPTGIACEFPEGYFGLMFPRSGVGVKKKLALLNTAGVIDNSFRGEIMMAFVNNNNHTQIIEPGDRLAELILLPYIHFDIVEADELTPTERGEGGFGSTGK